MKSHPTAGPSGGARKPPTDGHSLETLRAALHGPLVTPNDSEYESARRVHNAMIDRRPAAIARCVEVADVITVVNFARERDLALSVRGGGHNVAGFGTNDGGLVLDLSRMREVRVDPEARIARVGGGSTWGDFDRATHGFGLASTGGLISTTGVGGLTLGGGFGHLTRKCGLACDNLLSAEVVLADGTCVTASETRNADLFWALRGGGGNFGVVTSLEFRLHPVSTVLAGPVLHPLERATELLRFWRDWLETAPEEATAFFAFMIVPPAPPFPEALHGTTMCAVVPCYAGPREKGEEALRPLRQFGPPVLDLVGEMPYPALQQMFDALQPAGLQQYWKSDFVLELREEAIDAHVRFGPHVPTVQTALHVYPMDGAAHRIAPDATAFSYRDARFVHVIAATFPDPADRPKNVAWVRDYWNALHPYSAPGTYVNFMMDEGDARIRATYRGNYDRLAAAKTAYDPGNLFRMNQNIPPART